MKSKFWLSALILVLLLSFLISFSSCNSTESGETPNPTETSTESSTETSTESSTETETETESTSSLYKWSLADLGAGVDSHTKLQKLYLVGDYSDIENFAKGTAELSRPVPVVLSWTATPENENGPTVEKYVVELSATSDFSNARSFETTENSFDIYNLYLSSLYYWRVSAILSDGQTVTSEAKAFATSDTAPRNLYVDGITNVRDLGGWKTIDGKRVKQGMIYRSGRLNESSSNKLVVEITKQGIATLHDDLGIKTQIDLRRVDNNEVGSIKVSPLGKDVNYISVPMEWNVGNILTDNIDQVKKVFAILADESNYPIIYHCNIGTDRTGMFAFIINALTGVTLDDLYRDYLFSNFGLINGTRSASSVRSSYLRTISSYDGDTLKEKTRNCLIDLGIPSSDIDAVIRIMTEG